MMCTIAGIGRTARTGGSGLVRAGAVVASVPTS
jgi:hypothetical protein